MELRPICPTVVAAPARARRLAWLVAVAGAVALGCPLISTDPAAAAPPNTAMYPTSGPAVVVVGGTELAVWRGRDGAAWTASGVAPAPGSAQSLGGVIVGAPGLATNSSGQVAMVARGRDDAGWVRFRDDSGNWSPWRSLGGGLKHAPTIVSWGPGRFDVIAVGLDNAVWHRSTANSGTSWSNWWSLGGVATSSPDAASQTQNTLDLVARGADQAVWHRAWTGSRWTDWTSLGGVADSAPALAAPAPGRLFVLARGGDGATYWRAYQSGWTTWARRDGQFADDPAATAAGGVVHINALGLDGRLWSARSNSGWWARTWAQSSAPVDPYGVLETVGVQYADKVVVSGWAVDASDPTVPTRVDVVVDGVVRGSATATVARADVGAHGFDVTVPAAPGARRVCAVARDVGVGDDVVLGCRDLAPPPPGNYSFVSTEVRGHPVRFNPCARIPIVFNPAGGPASGRSELDAAITELRKFTGLDLFVEGHTNEVAGSTRSGYDPARYGARWSPILVGFSDPQRVPALGGSVAGLGGMISVSGPDGRVGVSGLVVLDGPQVSTLPLGFGQGVTLAKLIAHELGHVIGLGHVSDYSQLMAPTIPYRAGSFGTGDAAGGWWLGPAQACRRVPIMGGIAAASAVAEDPESIDHHDHDDVDGELTLQP